MHNDHSVYYHERAEEIRAVALRMDDAKERTRILKIADGYQRKADAQALTG